MVIRLKIELEFLLLGGGPRTQSVGLFSFGCVGSRIEAEWLVLFPLQLSLFLYE